MKIKERAIKDLEALKPADLLIVYDLILSLKGKMPKQSSYRLIKESEKRLNNVKVL